AALWQLAGRGPALGAFGFSRSGQLLDLVQLLPGVDRAHNGILVQWGAEPLHRGVGYRFLAHQPGARAADVTLVEENAVHDSLDRRLDRRIVEDHVRGLAAEFQGQPLAGARNHAADLLTHLGGAGERDLVHAGVRHQRGPGLARAGDDIDDAGRQIRLLADLG